MSKKRIVLTFPSRLVDQPITYHLIKDHNLMVNILRANITPKEEGRLVIEIGGNKKDMESGMNYLIKGRYGLFVFAQLYGRKTFIVPGLVGGRLKFQCL